MSNTFATLPVMAGDDVPAGPVDPIFNRLLKDRIIWMGEEVKDDMANRICAQLLMLAAEDPKKDIWLYINSPGGSITAGMAIYDTMQLIEPDVATVGLGMCASMGQFLLSSGTKGKRYLTSHARVLMHQPSGGIGGTATDVRINAELIMDMKKTMSELTAEQTGHTLEEIYRDNEYDHWFTAQEALDYGFVDKLVTTPDTIGNLRVDYLHKMQRVYESEINRMQDMMDHTTNAREAAAASKRKDKLTKQLKECRDYDEKISHLALSRIALDLDDGVKVNYRKLQTAADGKFYEVLADSKNIMVKEKK